MTATEEKGVVLLDVGGTGIKGMFAPQAAFPCGGGLREFSARSDGSEEEILGHFAEIIRSLAAGRAVSAAAMAFPGPFDYEKGVPLMRGIGKYDALCGVSLPEALRARMPELAGARFLFLHDVEAFALGESAFGEGGAARRLLCLCLGTGAGSAFLQDGKVLKGTAEESAAGEMNRDGARQAGVAVPRNGWIYDTPFRDSIIDDYLSVRGLKKLARDVLGYEADGRELARLCAGETQQGERQADDRQENGAAQTADLAWTVADTTQEAAGGNHAAQNADLARTAADTTQEAAGGNHTALAREVWRRFGETLAEAVTPFLDSFRPDGVVLGGQITKSFCYFGEPFAQACAARGVRLTLEPETSLRAVQGLWQALQGRESR